MPFALNNVATEDKYSAGTTLECPRGVRINFDVNNAAIYFQIGLNTAVHKTDPNQIMELLGGSGLTPIGNIIYGQEVFSIAKSFTLSRICDSIRIRSAAAGVPARVNLSVWKLGELIGP